MFVELVTARGAGLDQCYFYIEGLELKEEGFNEAFDGPFCGAVGWRVQRGMRQDDLYGNSRPSPGMPMSP